MIFAGIIGGFLPILQGWILILGGIILYRTTQEKDWRLPSWIDSRLPKKAKDLIYKDISLHRHDRKKQQKKTQP